MIRPESLFSCTRHVGLTQEFGLFRVLGLRRGLHGCVIPPITYFRLRTGIHRAKSAYPVFRNSSACGFHRTTDVTVGMKRNLAESVAELHWP